MQGVSVCLVEGSIYSIQCSYIAGSNSVSGCSYVLLSVVQDTRDIHGIIDESSTVNKDVPNIEDYGRILVYDEVKVLVMNETLDLEKIGSCTITGISIIINYNIDITSAFMLSHRGHDSHYYNCCYKYCPIVRGFGIYSSIHCCCEATYAW